MKRPSLRVPMIVPISIALGTALLSVAFNTVYFQGGYFEADTVAYLFQAKLFSQGRLAAEAPPDAGFSPSTNINIINGTWYSKYPFGNSLALSFGVLVGAPWLIPAVATGLSVFLLYLLLLRIYGSEVAMVGIILAAISPSTTIAGAAIMSEAVNRMFLAIFLLMVVLALQRRSWLASATAAFALGFAFNTRTLTAGVFGLAGALFLGWSSRCDVRQLLRLAAGAAPVLILMGGLALMWNSRMTGSPFQSTHNVMHPYDRPGFGPRAPAYIVVPSEAYQYTPVKGLQRLVMKTIPAVLYSAFGWGYYDPSINERLKSGSLSTRLTLGVGMLPLLLVLLLIALPMGFSDRNGCDLLFLGIIALNLGLYFFFYWDGATFGFSPLHTRYYTECILLAVIPLVARSLCCALTGWSRRRSGYVLAGGVIAAVLLMANTVWTFTRYPDQFRATGDFYWRVEKLVHDRAIHHAVVFVSGRQAPLGDYPFHSLVDADVVYFRLGEDKAWGLTNSDWQPVYRRYFNGRQAFLYENGDLKSVE